MLFFNNKKLCHKIFLLTFLSYYFHYVYCHYCCRDNKWPCEGPLFHFRVKLSHSLFSLILKQDWMRLSWDVSSNQDRVTSAWPGDYLIKCPALCLQDKQDNGLGSTQLSLRQSSCVPIGALQIPPGSKPSSQYHFQTRTWDIVLVLKFSFHRDNGKTAPPW